MRSFLHTAQSASLLWSQEHHKLIMPDFGTAPAGALAHVPDCHLLLLGLKASTISDAKSHTRQTVWGVRFIGSVDTPPVSQMQPPLRLIWHLAAVTRACENSATATAAEIQLSPMTPMASLGVFSDTRVRSAQITGDLATQTRPRCGVTPLGVPWGCQAEDATTGATTELLRKPACKPCIDPESTSWQRSCTIPEFTGYSGRRQWRRIGPWHLSLS